MGPGVGAWHLWLSGKPEESAIFGLNKAGRHALLLFQKYFFCQLAFFAASGKKKHVPGMVDDWQRESQPHSRWLCLWRIDRNHPSLLLLKRFGVIAEQ